MALPGVTHLDHFACTVPDMEEATRFLVDVLGFQVMWTNGAMNVEGDFMAENVNVHRDARIQMVRYFTLGKEVSLELFEYTAPDQRTELPRNSDIGGHHVCLHVNSLEDAIDYLRSHGVRVLNGPKNARGLATGMRWVYFMAPWGMQFELVSYPDGRVYDHRKGTLTEEERLTPQTQITP
ncbi:MAG: hypothetical protein BGO95_03255 [Micrococcales bacterium 73-13]|nr:MAG: hypothetical protein BGO95_03255 [Micrococcales bacterium 73-13]